jgi:hypothetical protein
MFTLLSGAYLLAIMASVVAALAGGSALAARRRFRSGRRWAGLSVAGAVIGAALGGSWMYGTLVSRAGSLEIAIVFWPIVATVIGGALPLVATIRLGRIEPPPARGNRWPVFVLSGLSIGDQCAELTIDGASMQIAGSAQRFVIPFAEVARVAIDVATIVIERAAAGPEIRIYPAVGDQAAPLALRTAALRLHKRLLAELAARSS